MKEVRQVGY